MRLFGVCLFAVLFGCSVPGSALAPLERTLFEQELREHVAIECLEFFVLHRDAVLSWDESQLVLDGIVEHYLSNYLFVLESTDEYHIRLGRYTRYFTDCINSDFARWIVD